MPWVWPDAQVQTCIVHLLRNSYRYASKRDWDALRRDLKPMYQAASEADARTAFEVLAENWGERYPTIVKLWDAQWATLTPFLAWDVEIRKLICSTNAIESINARVRRAVNARGHFPTEAAALKCVYMALMALDPKGTGRKRWTMRWKIALQAFETTFPGRLGIDTNQGQPTENYRPVTPLSEQSLLNVEAGELHWTRLSVMREALSGSGRWPTGRAVSLRRGLGRPSTV